MPAIPCCSLLVDRRALPTFSLCRITIPQHGLQTMPGKAWDNTILSDGISTVLTKEARSSATTILRQMMMPSCMATIGIASVQQILISIHPPHNGRQHSRTQRIMQAGAVAVCNSSITLMTATTTTSATIHQHTFSAKRKAVSMLRHTPTRYM